MLSFAHGRIGLGIADAAGRDPDVGLGVGCARGLVPLCRNGASASRPDRIATVVDLASAEVLVAVGLE